MAVQRQHLKIQIYHKFKQKQVDEKSYFQTVLHLLSLLRHGIITKKSPISCLIGKLTHLLNS
jgi:hypothetical protein